MPRRTPLSNDTTDFFEYWREQYRWPSQYSRQLTELRISEIVRELNQAIIAEDSDAIFRSLVSIHKWKTSNRAGVSNKYERELRSNLDLISYLQNTLPFLEDMNYNRLIEILQRLMIKYCNLPVATSQLSFLSERRFPILDRFVSQFFSQTVSDVILKSGLHNFNIIFRDIKPIPFLIEDNGMGKATPRLAVYTPNGRKRNTALYAKELVPELIAIASSLHEQGAKFVNVKKRQKEFSVIDVEMAVFAFGIQNRQYFEGFYTRQPESLGI